MPIWWSKALELRYRFRPNRSLVLMLYVSHIHVDAFLVKQKGQHPLTGQRAANFRLLANQ